MKQCITDPSNPGICLPVPTAPSCVPPLIWRVSRCECPEGGLPSSAGLCQPPEPPPPPPLPKCEITISYIAGAPHAVAVASATDNPQCTAESAAIAMALIIARLLGAP